MIAANEGYPSICQLLINHGADVNAGNNIKTTSLMFAAYGKGRDSVSTVELLLKNGADPGVQDVYGETALFKTAFHGQFNVAQDESAEIVQLLL